MQAQVAWSMPQKWMLGSNLPKQGFRLLPDFLCIGAQKSGTSWLMDKLNRHPDIFVPQDLEYYDVHYFDRNFHRPLSDYMKYFAGGEGRVKGECTPAYGFLPESRIAWIRKILPELRIILMIRNPIERAWSHARMNLVSQAGCPFESVPEQRFLDHFHSRRSRVRGDYLEMLRKWERQFPASQIFTGFFDDISDAPKQLLEGAMNHLGVSTAIPWEQWQIKQVVNPGTKISIPEKFQRELKNIYCGSIEKLEQRFGAKVSRWTNQSLRQTHKS